MDHPMERIAEAELEVMRVLWDAGKAMPVAEIRQEVRRRTGWEGSTAKTLLYRLESKGAVAKEKRGVFYYAPRISEADYNAFATQSLVDRLYKGSVKDLLASFVSSGKLNNDDIDELRRLLAEAKDA